MNDKDKDIAVAKISAKGTVVAAIISAVALITVPIVVNWKTIFPEDNQVSQLAPTESATHTTQPSKQPGESPKITEQQAPISITQKLNPASSRKAFVESNITNLVWSNTYIEPGTWVEASMGKINNFSGGRLPTIQEAQALVESSIINKIIIDKGYYWTSSTDGKKVKVINLTNGNIRETTKDTLNLFLLVREN